MDDHAPANPDAAAQTAVSPALDETGRAAKNRRDLMAESSDIGVRILGGTLAVVGMAVLGVARYITPSVEGMGSHQSLGLPPCGFYQTTGLPCVSCGMTTSFALAVRGQLWQAFYTQPAGALLAVLTAAMVLMGLYSAVTGVSLAPAGKQLARPAVFILLGVVVVVAWLYKMAVVLGNS